MKKICGTIMLIALLPIFTACEQGQNIEEALLEDCQRVLKEQVKFHPRLSNIQKLGEYKYSFDVDFIYQGESMEAMGFFNKHYECEFFPEEGMVYTRFSEKQLALDAAEQARLEAEREAEREAQEAHRKNIAILQANIEAAAAEKAAQEAEKNARRAEEAARAKLDKMAEAEKKRVAAVKAKGEVFYAQLCRRTWGDFDKKTFEIRSAKFEENYTRTVARVSDYRDQFGRDKICLIISEHCVAMPDHNGEPSRTRRACEFPE